MFFPLCCNRPKEFHHPKARVTARLLFSVFLCMTVSISLLVFLFQEDIPFKTVQHWGSSYAEDQFVPTIYSANATQNSNYKTITASMLCPCSNTAVSWMSYVDFYTISYTLEVSFNPYYSNQDFKYWAQN